MQQFARILLELFILARLLELCILQRFFRILFELLVQPKVLELCILNQFSRILQVDDYTNDVVVVVDDDDDDDDDDGDAAAAADDDDNDDNDDNDPVELFQKRGKWWELIVRLPWTIHINPYYISIYHGILTPVRQICISALMYAFDVTPARKTWFGDVWRRWRRRKRRVSRRRCHVVSFRLPECKKPLLSSSEVLVS